MCVCVCAKEAWICLSLESDAQYAPSNFSVLLHFLTFEFKETVFQFAKLMEGLLLFVLVAFAARAQCDERSKLSLRLIVKENRKSGLVRQSAAFWMCFLK